MPTILESSVPFSRSVQKTPWASLRVYQSCSRERNFFLIPDSNISSCGAPFSWILSLVGTKNRYLVPATSRSPWNLPFTDQFLTLFGRIFHLANQKAGLLRSWQRGSSCIPSARGGGPMSQQFFVEYSLSEEPCPRCWGRRYLIMTCLEGASGRWLIKHVSTKS